MSTGDISNIIRKINYIDNLKLEDMKKFKQSLKRQYYLPETKQANLKNFVRILN